MKQHAYLSLLLTSVLLSNCTMPLPQDNPISEPVIQPSSAQGLVQEVSELQLRRGIYANNELIYLDLDTCSTFNCINGLSSSLSPLIRYDFIFADGSPVLGQRSVFNAPVTAANAPFRRVIQVTVPEGYQPNTLRSSEDVINSGFRTVPTPQVQNLPLISTQLGDENVQQPQGEAWLADEVRRFLNLGTVPYSPAQNRLGVGTVYFMRNRDKTDLPSLPLPVFDSAPGDLLYSPVRQVFRAISENQIESLADDPTLQIQSLEDLLKAVNEGVFRLENTQEFFNYPVQSLVSNPDTPLPSGSPITQNRFNAQISDTQNLPELPINYYYALWVQDTANETRLIKEFRPLPNGQLQASDGTTVNLQEDLFQFSTSEVGRFRSFSLTIETGKVLSPSGSVLLEARYGGRELTKLSPSFAERYALLQDGTYLMAVPSSSERNINHRSGLWLAQRTDRTQRTPSLPLSLNLEPGLILSLPPTGWVYNGWIKNNVSSDFWLETGRFRAVNQPDQKVSYYDPLRTAYPYPGEDFLRNAPIGLFFPVNLPSTGERELVISLEPENMPSKKPFFSLFRQTILKGTPPLVNQKLPFTPVSFPTLSLRLVPINSSR